MYLVNKKENFDSTKLRASIQRRVDQNIKELEHYWQKVTNIPKSQFYKTRIDSRTVGKLTLKKYSNEVLRVRQFSTENTTKNRISSRIDI